MLTMKVPRGRDPFHNQPELPADSLRALNIPPDILDGEIAQRVAQLGEDDHKIREGAGRRLLELAVSHPTRVLSAVRQAQQNPDLEVARRAEWLEATILRSDATVSRAPGEAPNFTLNRYACATTFTVVVHPTFLEATGPLPDKEKIKLQANMVRRDGKPIEEEYATNVGTVTNVQLAPDGKGIILRCEVRGRFGHAVQSAQIEMPTHVKGATKNTPVSLCSYTEIIEPFTP
jgi:hypothetical protein